MDKITINRIIVTPEAGSHVKSCIIQCIAVAWEQETTVVLEHNTHEYTISPAEITKFLKHVLDTRLEKK